MYQIFFTEGEYEPWWFFEDWKTLVLSETSFPTYEEAVRSYNEHDEQLTSKYPFKKTKGNYLVAYWSEDESVYCESCEDDIQLYYGLMLLKNDKAIEETANTCN